MKDKDIDIILRPIGIDDAEVLMELNNNEEVSNMLAGNGQEVNLEQQKAWMENLENEKNTRRWMIVYENHAVGTVFLSSINFSNCTGNVNIKLLPLVHGKGIGSIAIKKACQIAFEEMSLWCITASVLEYNIASQKMLEKVGFQVEGRLRSRVIKNGKRCDLIAFSLLKTDVLDDEFSDEGNR